MNIELIQLSGRDGDVTYNLAKVCEAINNAHKTTDLIVFPETYLTGFPTKENIAQIAEPLTGPSITEIHRLAKLKNVAVVVGMSESSEGNYYNTSVLITPEEGVLASYRKTHLWETDKEHFPPRDRFAILLQRSPAAKNSLSVRHKWVFR